MKDRLTDEDRQSYVTYRINRAKEALNECDILKQGGSYNAAINRLYYACFYAASALLMANKIEATTHQGVRTMLGLHFVSTGKLSPHHNTTYSRLFNDRMDGDYVYFVYFTAEEVEQLRPQAEEFINAVIGLIEEIDS